MMGVVNRLAVVLLLCASVAAPSFAAEPLEVNSVALPDLNWGSHQARVEITNPSGYVRYVIAETEVQFAGDGLNPNRRVRSADVVYPEETRTLAPKIAIPGNYGTLTATVRLYDVVDTLDDVFPSMLFFDTTMELKFDPPASVQPYLEHQITMPPRVNIHPYFDNEFSRLLSYFLSRGMSEEQIRQVTGGDSAYIAHVISQFEQKRYVTRTDDGALESGFPFITIDEAYAELALARRVSDSLVDLYTANMPHMIAVRDSLAQAGVISSDTLDFLNGATPLYKPYPLIGMFSLWSSLGRSFITRAAPLHIYDATDFCNAYIPYYMYAVQGPDSLQGNHFYGLEIKSYPQFYFCDRIPELECDPDYIRKAMTGQRVLWRFEDDYSPTVYMFDSNLVHSVIDHLETGADSLLSRTYRELLDTAAGYGHPTVSFGHRYWFWNLVATRTLQRLVDKGVVSRGDEGEYRFDQARLF